MATAQKLPKHVIMGRLAGTGSQKQHGITGLHRIERVMPGDFLAVCTAGAYGFVQSSNYNSRPRVPEVLVEGERYRIVRQRETYEDLIRGEVL